MTDKAITVYHMFLLRLQSGTVQTEVFAHVWLWQGHIYILIYIYMLTLFSKN